MKRRSFLRTNYESDVRGPYKFTRKLNQKCVRKIEMQTQFFLGIVKEKHYRET
jgi:hypothetical protein